MGPVDDSRPDDYAGMRAWQSLTAELFAELDRSGEEHSCFPRDMVRGAGIVCEEAGETMKEALDATRAGAEEDATLGGPHLTGIRMEALQTAAAALNLIITIDSIHAERQAAQPQVEAGPETEAPTGDGD